MPENLHQPHPTHLLRPIPFGAVAGPGALLWAGDLWLAGYHLAESTGAAAATVQVFDGGNTGGIPLTGPIVLAANGADRLMFGGHLLAVQNGLFVAVLAGSVSGVMYLADR